MQIRPNAPLPIVYVISDPSDANTYYVRSVLRNSSTGAIIRVNGLNYVNLTVDASNSRRFSKLITAPQDSSGAGFYIDVTTTVYTDSGYTVVSTSYQEDNVKYLVLEPWSIALGSGGGRGGWEGQKESAEKIDYKKIEEIIKRLLAEREEKETSEPINLDPVFIHLLDIKGAIKEIKIPEPQAIDLGTHTSAILQALGEAIKGIEFPEQENIDLQPILSAIESLRHPDPLSAKEHSKNIEEVRKELSKIREALPHQKYLNLIGDMEKRITGRTKEEDPMINRLKGLGIKS